jgi:Arc/MetJ family transcription regulator
MFHMRTTLDLPEDLLNDAQTSLGFRSKTDTVIMALRALVRQHRVDELKGLMGKVRLDIDIPRSRRRLAAK